MGRSITKNVEVYFTIDDLIEGISLQDMVAVVLDIDEHAGDYDFTVPAACALLDQLVKYGVAGADAGLLVKLAETISRVSDMITDEMGEVIQ